MPQIKSVLCVAHIRDIMACKALEALDSMERNEKVRYSPKTLRVSEGSRRITMPCIVFRSAPKERVVRHRPERSGDIRFRGRFLRIVRYDMQKNAPPWAPGARLVICVLDDKELVECSEENFRCAVRNLFMNKRAMKRFDTELAIDN